MGLGDEGPGLIGRWVYHWEDGCTVIKNHSSHAVFAFYMSDAGAKVM